MASDRDVLSDHVKPINYAISLTDLTSGEPWTYQGKVDIDVEVKKATKSITLNTFELKVHSAEFVADSGKHSSVVKASDISFDTKNQRCTFTFDQELPQSPKAVLSIAFEGIMNNHMAGFYRSKYQPTVEASNGVARDSENHYMFSTQFESSDARRAFPCFDEPNLKATFDFEMEIPDDLVALSNMPEKQTRKSKDGYKVVSFDRTPVMSTYLLAWAFGDFVGEAIHGIWFRTDSSAGIRRGFHEAEVQWQELACPSIHNQRLETARSIGFRERTSDRRLLFRGMTSVTCPRVVEADHITDLRHRLPSPQG